ncbi:MAG TPA: hypothetical protein DD381_09300 [Lentisphaeria bacterium]|nr:MAG: hypothetical protein A2X47_13505 [Lentisphaerae bacterium GWF2_38_69]HBM16519.1 hypothetical protein [Lentisphaeria bacterium]
MTPNKFHYYDGKIYKCIFDPVLKEVRAIITEQIPSGSKVIDIGCGTGALAFKLAKSCELVTGIELSSRMITFADKRRREKKIDNIVFVHSDAAYLPSIKDKKYDYAVMSMIMHELPLKYRSGILNEAVRIAKKIIIADYSTPLPFNLHGTIVRAAEFFAGIEHFSGFRSYQKNGGIYGFLEEKALQVKSQLNDSSGVFSIVQAQ